MIDWQQIFVPEGSLLEPVVRGTIMYLAIFAIFRIAPTRQLGQLNTADLLVVVLVADVSQNAFANDYKSILEGLVLVLTILFWNFLIDWLAFRFPALERVLEHRRVTLVKDGRILWRNLRREHVSREELFSHLRAAGIADEKQVRLATIEPDGQISVVPLDA
jgi:uncharacterized membrane protein YcaP (DUF421 family)